MNERIKELAEKAGSTHKQNLGVYQFYTDELEKFVKLIIKDIADDLGQIKWLGDDDGWDWAIDTVRKDLIKQYGLENVT